MPNDLIAASRGHAAAICATGRVAWTGDFGAVAHPAVEGLGDADGHRTSQIQHAVEGMNGDFHCGTALNGVWRIECC
jgi:hypothetical protein